MRVATFVVLLLAVVGACFAAGALTARRPAAAPPSSPTSASPPVAGAPAAAAPAMSLPKQQRFRRPPLPADDPGFANWIENGPAEPPPHAFDNRLKDIDRRLDELFGADFPVAKRKQVLAAQESWMRRHSEAVWDYYHGYISQAEMTNLVHRNMILLGHETEAALSADEYRRFFQLEPGADPFAAVADPTLQAGDPVPIANPSQPAATH